MDDDRELAPGTAGRGPLMEPVDRRRVPRETVRDLVTVAAVVLLVGCAAVFGRALLASGTDIFLGWPPLLAGWLPHVGPGTPAALAVAAVVVSTGPWAAARLPWRSLLVTAWATATVWTFALALVDGWGRGVAGRLATDQEYLSDVPRADAIGSVGAVLRVFADHIVTPAVDPAQEWGWSTHVGAHPPGALLFFLVLDRIGLGGGGPAAVVVMLAGASVCVAVAITARLLAGEDVARRMLPFSVLLPGAVWVGVSADGMFAAWLAWGTAAVAYAAGARGTRAVVAGLLAGLVLGFALFLSYGLVLGGLLPVAVLVATRRWMVLPVVAAGVLLVVGAFASAGFWWFTGLADTRVIYAASVAATRPYDYFVWANLAALAFVVGPAVIVSWWRLPVLPRPAALLVAAGMAAVLLADLSGLSKAEVERIWLPFAVWTVVACAALPRPRRWLLAQAVPALLVNHLLWTVW